MAHLKTRNVFLDTTVFVRYNFRFQKKPLSILSEYAAQNHIRLIFTDIVVSEVKAKIREWIEKATTAHNKFLKEARILRNSKSSDVVARLLPLDKKKLIKEMLASFRKFLKDSNVIIIAASKEEAEPIFEAYFSGEAPFGTGKKKHEFPDAFTIAALRTWCQKRKESLYVISNDLDIQKACTEQGPLYDMQVLNDFLNDLVLDTKEDVADFLHSELINYKPHIVKQIMRDFPDRGFTITGVEDWDAEVEEVRVTEVDIEDMAFEVVEISDGCATVFVAAQIYYEADLHYGDVDNAAWDGEDKQYIYIDHVKETVQRDAPFDVEITVSFEGLNPDSFDVESVSVDAPSTIEVETDRDAGWPYK